MKGGERGWGKGLIRPSYGKGMKNTSFLSEASRGGEKTNEKRKRSAAMRAHLPVAAYLKSIVKKRKRKKKEVKEKRRSEKRRVSILYDTSTILRKNGETSCHPRDCSREGEGGEERGSLSYLKVKEGGMTPSRPSHLINEDGRLLKERERLSLAAVCCLI